MPGKIFITSFIMLDNSLFAQTAHLRLTVKQLRRVIKNLDLQLQKAKFENAKLREENSELSRRLAEHESFSIIPSSNTQLASALIRCLVQNAPREPQGRRYDGLENFFALLSYMGPHYFELLHTQLMFPTYRSAQTYREEIFARIGASENLFDGSDENITMLLNFYLPPQYQGKLILLVDAASVTPYVQVHPNGQVVGLIGIDHIEEADAQVLIDDEEAFDKFVIENREKVINAMFGIMVAPTHPNHCPFPLCCISAVSGTASAEMITNIETIIALLNGRGFKIVGLSTDGDNTYRRYSYIIADQMLRSLFKFAELNVLEVLEKIDPTCHFSDPYHLAKRDRYRKVSLWRFRPNPLSHIPYYSLHDLLDVGVPDYILSDDSARKMEDALPLKLFNLTVLTRVIDTGEFGLIFSMLPTTLLLESLHSKDLPRQKRIDYLMFGASLIIVYLQLLEYAESHDYYYSDPNGKKTKKEMIFTYPWCVEYLSTTLSIAALLATEEEIHLGSCGTHFLEHLFGSIRRHSGGEDTQKRFLSSMKQVFLERYLASTLEIPLQPPNRRSDSGFIVRDPLNVFIHPLRSHLTDAKRLMANFVKFPEEVPLVPVNDFDTPMTIEELKALFGDIKVEKRILISTRSIGKTATGGLSNARRWKAKGQIVEFVDK